MAEFNEISKDIFTVDDLFTAAECDQYVELAESVGFSDAPINTFMGPQVDKSFRSNTRVMIDDEDRAKELWERSCEFVPAELDHCAALGLNERFRYYRYEPGQSFRWHVDAAFMRFNGEKSKLTYLLYLNDDFEGGETLFEDHVVKPKKGTVLLFRHFLRHEGAKVKKGKKYVLRTDVMYASG